MPAISVDFQWGVAKRGYEFAKSKGYPFAGIATPDSLVIRPRGDDFRPTRPLKADGLYLAFGKLDPDDKDAILAFANLHGLLGFWLGETEEERWQKPEYLDDWQRAIKSMKRMIELNVTGKLRGEALMRDRNSWFGRADIGLQIGEGQQHPSLRIRPSSLLSGIRIQFAQLVAGGAAIKACMKCGTWFEVGGRSRKRTDAEFCSTKCRNNFYNARR